MNIGKKINLLLIALRKRDVFLMLNKEQYYSEKRDDVCTKYILFEEHPKKDGIVFFSQIQVLKYLAELYRKLGDLSE